MILVTGAAGKTGLAILRALSKSETAVRAFVRNERQSESVLAAGASQWVAGDLRDPAALEAALSGVQKVYHICPNMHPDEVVIGRLMLEAARQAGVEHFVYHSVLHPQTEKMPHHWNKLRVEELVLESGLPFTILQPTAYMQNLLAYRQQVCSQGVYAVPYSGDAALSLVDLLDVAAAAVKVLQEDGHIGATYELVGTMPLTGKQIAAMLSRLLGRPVRFERLSAAEWRLQAERQGLQGYALDALLKMFAYYDRYGLVGNPMVLGALLERKPTSLEAFLRREFVATIERQGEEL